MNASELAPAAALTVGGLALLGAAVAWLFRRTAGVPAGRRAQAMLRLAGAMVQDAATSWPVVSAVSGLLAFAGTALVGFGLTVLILLVIPKQVPHPTEAHEGIGDALIAMAVLVAGGAVSLCVAAVVGIAVGSYAAARWAGPQQPFASRNGPGEPGPRLSSISPRTSLDRRGHTVDT
jgi:hypothetical protein